ncbi:MAG: diguanylate cyclase [Desulfobulbaceae bacterium]
MKQKRHLVRYLLFFIVIQAITLFSLSLFKREELDSFFSKRQIDIEGQYSLITSSYQRRIQMGYEKTFSTPEVLSLMEQAAAADAEERNRLRRELYNRFLPLYRILLKNSFRQVHFHLADTTSFLRMHLPELYGDQLDTIRPSVAEVNRSGKPIDGFEIGRNWQAYRFVFPLARNGHQLGSVEISLPMSTLLNDLMASFPAEYRFIANKELAAKHLDPADLRKHFSTTSFSDAFLQETEEPQAIAGHKHVDAFGHIDQDEIDQIDQALQQLDYVKRGGGEIFLIFADLDNMKWINDHLGHEAGDKALIATARLLRTAVRDADIVGRMGGDEFAILFTSASSSDSEPILLARLEHELALINKGVPAERRISISFGIAHDPGGGLP